MPKNKVLIHSGHISRAKLYHNTTRKRRSKIYKGKA